MGGGKKGSRRRAAAEPPAQPKPPPRAAATIHKKQPTPPLARPDSRPGAAARLGEPEGEVVEVVMRDVAAEDMEMGPSQGLASEVALPEGKVALLDGACMGSDVAPGRPLNAAACPPPADSCYDDHVVDCILESDLIDFGCEPEASNSSCESPNVNCDRGVREMSTDGVESPTPTDASPSPPSSRATPSSASSSPALAHPSLHATSHSGPTSGQLRGSPTASTTLPPPPLPGEDAPGRTFSLEGQGTWADEVDTPMDDARGASMARHLRGGGPRGGYGSVSQYDLEEELGDGSWEGLELDLNGSSEEWEVEEWEVEQREWTEAELTVFASSVLSDGPLTAVYTSPHLASLPQHGLISLEEGPECLGSVTRDAMMGSPLSTLEVGRMRVPLLGWRTPVLHWVPGTDAAEGEAALEYLLMPAELLADETGEGDALSETFLCLALTSVASASQRERFIQWLGQRSTLIRRHTPPEVWERIAVPSADELQSEWAVAGVQRSSAAFQHAMLTSARLIAASCSAVSASVASAATRNERLPRAVLRPQATRRLRHSLELTRTSLQHISTFSDCVGRAVVQGGQQAATLTCRAIEMIGRDENGAPSRAAELWRDKVQTPISSVASSISASIPTSSKTTLARAVSASGDALLAVADSAALAKGLVYVSLRKASAEIAECFLGPEVGEVVVEGLDTLAIMQSTVSSVAMHGVGRIIANSDSVALANKIVYVGLKRGSSEAVAKRFGAAAGLMTADGFENIATHGRLTGAVTLNSMGWALSAVNHQPPPRIITSTVRHPVPKLPASAAGEAADETVDVLPPAPTTPAPKPIVRSELSREGVAPVAECAGVQAQPQSTEVAADCTGNPEADGRNTIKSMIGAVGKFDVESKNSPVNDEATLANEEFDDLSLGELDGEGDDVWLLLGLPWREGFLAMLVANDDTLPADGTDTPSRPAGNRRTWQRVWCVVQDSAVTLFDHKHAAECPSRAPIAEIDWSEIRSLRLEPRNVFTLQIGDDEQPLILRAQDMESCAEWVSCLLRLVSWRSVRAIQRECAPEWEEVAVQSELATPST